MSALLQAAFDFDAAPLADLEAVIERGQHAFMEVGLALRAIQEHRRYEEAGYRDFDDYCRRRWGWSQWAGYKYLQAAEVAGNLDASPNRPRLTQTRVLAPLPPDEQREIAQEVDFGSTTVAELREIIRVRREGADDADQAPEQDAPPLPEAAPEAEAPPPTPLELRFDKAEEACVRAQELAEKLAGAFARRLTAADFDLDTVQQFARALEYAVFWLKKAEKIRRNPRSGPQE